MNKLALLVFAFAFASVDVSANTNLLLNETGVLVGATNVEVEGTLFNVSFIDGACVDVFNPCTAPTDFAFQGEDAALAAALALNSVFIEAGFANNPGRILGCSPIGELCEIATPYGFGLVNTPSGGKSSVTTAYSIITSHSPPGSDGFVRRDPVNEDFSGISHLVYAVWSRELIYNDVVRAPDLNGDGSPETVALIGSRVRIMDSVTGTWIKQKHVAGGPRQVKAIAAFDSDNDGADGLAVLSQNRETDRISVEIIDFATGERMRRIRFFARLKMTPIRMVVADVDFDGSPDIGVLAVRADGRVAVEYRDGATGKKLPNWVADRIWFPR